MADHQIQATYYPAVKSKACVECITIFIAVCLRIMQIAVRRITTKECDVCRDVRSKRERTNQLFINRKGQT
jgi:hypothetical protein